jgi:hypothetical protein
MRSLDMYVFFQKETGKVLMTHRRVSPSGEALQVSRDELMHIAGRAALLLEQEDALESIDIIEVDRNSHLLRRVPSPDDRTDVYVDVEKRVLSERER